MAVLDWNALLEQAKAEGYSNEVVPAGPYEVEVVSVKVSPSKNGSPSIGVRIKILAGPHQNVSLWDNLYVTPDKPKGMAMFFRKAENYGADIAAFSRGESLDFIANSFIGRRGTADVVIDTYNNVERNKVSKFTPNGQVGVATPAALTLPPVASPNAGLPPIGTGGFVPTGTAQSF